MEEGGWMTEREPDDDDALAIRRRLDTVEDEQRRQRERLDAVEQRLSRIEGVLERVPRTSTLAIVLGLVATLFAGIGAIASGVAL
jgi:hypothetical protein